MKAAYPSDEAGTHRLLGLDVRRLARPVLIDAGKLGPVLWQLPENFHRDDERLHGWLDATASWRYVRFHYGARGRRGNYSATEIAQWAARIAQWRRAGEVYQYFNNDWEGFAPANALELRRRLLGRA